jgi:hypothetical protein
MKNKFIKLLITCFGVSIMLLIAVGSTGTSSSYNYYSACDDFLIEKYLYEKGMYKAAYENDRKCFARFSAVSQQEAIDRAKKHCQNDGRPNCSLLAVGNTIYVYSRYSNFKDINQDYTGGKNNVCNTTTPGGCTGAFKP